MKNYIVTANVELPAESAQEAEDIVMGCEFYDLEGMEVAETFIEIEKVVEVAEI
jgi:hypothetical protein